MSILDEADGTINRKAVIEDGAKEDIERIAVIISDNYHFTRDSCFIDIDADNIKDAAIKYNSLENDFNYVVNNLDRIIQLIHKGYTFQQIKSSDMIQTDTGTKQHKTTEAQRRAIQKYNDKMAIVKLKVTPEYKDNLFAKAKAKGMTVTAYIKDLIDNDI